MGERQNAKKLYSIGEVSRICNVSKKALRFYDQIGVISPDMVSEENNYRYYSEETLLLVPVVKYYKQMGFSLEQMQSLVEGSTYQCLERSFLSKSEELQTERQELLYRYTAVKDWYELVREAELVSQRKEHDVTIKYVNSTVYCSKEQDFSYNYMESIINIPWVNYLESIHNEITGPVILNFPSFREKRDGTCRRARIMQMPLRPLVKDAELKTLGGTMMASVYHVGSLDTIGREYGKIEDIYEGEKHHPYTVGLFGSIPDITSTASRLTPIDGLMPDPTKPIPGCRFADRCPHCMEICNTKAPGMADFDGHQIKCFLYLQDEKNGGEGK